ncbi:CYTH domain-containing protein [Blautia sp.]|uniref:CYTH domain-containing protein n=1 Tax=Blautia sp. TaxID=1955243 RepID=UPI00258C9544|nr:CYTH domain-containing protein [Blautia sp.]
MKEIELKTMIDHQEFARIYQILKEINSNSFIQINYYYDTPGKDFTKNNETLRVRQKGAQLVLQHKYKKVSNGNIRFAEEYSEPLDGLKLFMEYKQQIVKLLGELVTYRQEFCVESAIICLDTNYYLGHIDYELEIEAKSIEIINRISEELLVEKKEIQGKHKRFMNRLFELEQCSKGEIKNGEKTYI